MFGSLRDFLGQRQNNNGDGDDQRNIESFTGGECSGIAVHHPPERRSPPSNGPTVLKVYRNGFILEDGEFRPFSDPANKKFFETIEKGDVPEELRERANAGTLSVSLLDCRHTDYEAPPAPPAPRYTLFGGTGQTLSGSASPGVSPGAVQTVRAATIQVDDTQPVTSVAIRFPNGSRVTERFNATTTVSRLRQYISESLGGVSSYTILCGFPPKPLEVEDSQTLQSAGLSSSSIIIKLP